MKTILRSKSADRLELHRELFLTDQHATFPSQVLSVIAEAWIDPQYHPLTDPGSKLTDLQTKQVVVNDRAFECPGRTVKAPGNYPDWGSDLVGRTYRSTELPGGIAELKFDSHFEGEPFSFEEHIVDFEIRP